MQYNKYKLFDNYIDNKLDIEKTWKQNKKDFPELKEFTTLIFNSEFDDYMLQLLARSYNLNKLLFFRASNDIITALVQEMPNMNNEDKQKLFNKVVSFINSLENAERGALMKGLQSSVESYENIKLDIQ